MGWRGGHGLAAAGVVVVRAIVKVAKVPMFDSVLVVGFDR